MEHSPGQRLGHETSLNKSEMTGEHTLYDDNHDGLKLSMTIKFEKLTNMWELGNMFLN